MDALRRAAVRVPDSVQAAPLDAALLECAFVSEPPSGTTPKFTCALRGGELVKVKYGRNPEIHAEAAASALLRRLGYPTDAVTIVPALRCYGCPRYPFLSNRLRARAWIAPLVPLPGGDGAFTDFSQVSVERKFPAPPLETEQVAGWGWWELKYSRVEPAELDALRLLAVLLAHWDNKSENQRIACLASVPAPGPNATCAEPVLMMQDLGATFGPYKVNLSAWRDAPIWDDAIACRISMRTLPFGGATFPPAQISEEGRQLLLARLRDVGDAELRRIFSDAQFHTYYAGTDDDRDLDAWMGVFRARVESIARGGPCPVVGS